MRQQLDTLAITAVQLLAPLLVALLGMLALRLRAYVNAKVKNTTLQGILGRLDDAALLAVQEVEQTVVKRLDPTKPFADNAAAAKAAALDSLKTHLGQKGLDEAKGVLGLGQADLEKLLAGYVESKVHVVNQAQQMIVQQQPVGGAS